MNSVIPRPHRPSWHTLAAVLAVLAIIAAGATATFTTASGHGTSTRIRTVADDESSMVGTPATITTTGVELTTDQVQALQSAAGGNPNLTADQAEAAASVPDGFGSGSASGICGTAILQGWDDGGWNFSLNFNAVVGAAAMGAVTVSTDGQFGASSKQFGVSGSSVYHDASRDGDLDSVGWGATATTLNGWALTNGAWLCVVSVTAPWNYSQRRSISPGPRPVAVRPSANQRIIALCTTAVSQAVLAAYPWPARKQTAAPKCTARRAPATASTGYADYTFPNHPHPSSADTQLLQRGPGPSTVRAHARVVRSVMRGSSSAAQSLPYRARWRNGPLVGLWRAADHALQTVS